MRTTAAVLLALALGLLAGFTLAHLAQQPRLTASLLVTEPPRVVVLARPGGGNESMLVAGLLLEIRGRGLAEPLPINGVVVYIDAALPRGGSQWIRLSRDAWGLEYSYWGDEVLVPGSGARIHISLVLDKDVKPLRVLVVARLGGRTAYAEASLG